MPQIKKRSPLLAFLFALFSSPLGQIYNGQLAKGLLLYLGFLSTLTLLLKLRIAQSFAGLVALIIFSLFGLAVMVVDATIYATKCNQIPLKKYNKWYVYAGCFLLFSVLATVFNHHITSPSFHGVRAFRIASSSMLPTLGPTDHVMANLWAYRTQAPKRGDLVVYQRPDSDVILLHRCVAVEGDTFDIRDGSVLINGQPIQEDYVQGPTELLSGASLIGVVPENSIIVLGDNRTQSADSRFFGYVTLDQVRGKPVYIYWAKDSKKIGQKIQ